VSSHRRQTRAYLEFKREVEDLLYDLDLDGIGSSIGSPRDEYSDEATRVLPILLHAQTAEAAELPWSDPDVRAQLVALGRRYRSLLRAGDVSAL
jgi:hypothetical protein